MKNKIKSLLESFETKQLTIDECSELILSLFEPKEQCKINYDRIVGSYNLICKSFPKVHILSDTRKKKIKLRFNQIGGYDEFEKLFKIVETTPFLKGDNKQNWQAGFDWLIENDTNFIKVLEGKYGNAPIIKPKIIHNDR